MNYIIVRSHFDGVKMHYEGEKRFVDDKSTAIQLKEMGLIKDGAPELTTSKKTSKG